jgi:triacylglycerol lipase
MIKAVQDSMHQWKHRSKHRQKREANVVCYGDLGCFEDNGPFGYIDMLPNSPEEIDTKFYVFSTKNRFVESGSLHNIWRLISNYL